MRSLYRLVLPLAALVLAASSTRALAQAQPPSKAVTEARQRADAHHRAAEKTATQRSSKTEIELRRQAQSVRAKVTQQGPQVRAMDQAVAQPRSMPADTLIARGPAHSPRTIEVPSNAIAGTYRPQRQQLALVEEQQLRIITDTELLRPTQEFHVEVGRPGYARFDRLGSECDSGVVEIERRYIDSRGRSIYFHEPYPSTLQRRSNFVDPFGRTRFSDGCDTQLHRSAQLRFHESTRGHYQPTPRERFSRDDRSNGRRERGVSRNRSALSPRSLDSRSNDRGDGGRRRESAGRVVRDRSR